MSDCCEGKPGVYSAIWCLCYRTSKLKRAERKGAIGGVTTAGEAQGTTERGRQLWGSSAAVGGADMGLDDGEGADAG
jgi:hypothetical protein